MVLVGATSDEADDTFGGYLASREESSPKTEVINLPQVTKPVHDGNFGDDFDIPDFLK